MHDCDYYEALMSRLLDGDLSEEEKKALREHLRTCPSCRQKFSVLSAMTVSLRDEDNLAEAPSSLLPGVMDRIAADLAEKKPPEKRVIHVQPPPLEKKPRHRLRRWALPAAAACLLLVAGGALFYMRSRPAGNGPGSSQQIRLIEAGDTVLEQSGPEEESAGAPITYVPDGAGTADISGQEEVVLEPPPIAVMDPEELSPGQPDPAPEQAAGAGEEPPAVRSVGTEPAPAAEGAVAASADEEPAGVAVVSAADSPETASLTATPEPTPLLVRDVARRELGYIAVEDIPAFAKLVSGSDILGGSPGQWQFLLSVEYADREISFACYEGETTLVWWDATHALTRADGSPEDLLALTALEEQPLPK